MNKQKYGDKGYCFTFQYHSDASERTAKPHVIHKSARNQLNIIAVLYDFCCWKSHPDKVTLIKITLKKIPLRKWISGWLLSEFLAGFLVNFCWYSGWHFGWPSSKSFLPYHQLIWKCTVNQIVIHWCMAMFEVGIDFCFLPQVSKCDGYFHALVN